MKAPAAVDQAGPNDARIISVNASDPTAPITAIGSNARSGAYDAYAKATAISAPDPTMIGRFANWIVCASIPTFSPSLIPSVRPRLTPAMIPPVNSIASRLRAAAVT